MGAKYKYPEIHPPESLRRYSKKEKRNTSTKKLTQIRKKRKKEKTSARKLTQISKKNDALNASKLTTESVTP